MPRKIRPTENSAAAAEETRAAADIAREQSLLAEQSALQERVAQVGDTTQAPHLIISEAPALVAIEDMDHRQRMSLPPDADEVARDRERRSTIA